MSTKTGLLTQKPDSPVPVVGQQRRFSLEQRQGKSGKPWTKIKGEGEGYGELYEVIEVKKTDFTDPHGNVSFNIGIKPADNGTNGSAPAPSNGNGRSAETQAHIERQHSQEMFLRYCAIKGAVPEDTKLIRAGIDWWQRDIPHVPGEPVAVVPNGVDAQQEELEPLE